MTEDQLKDIHKILNICITKYSNEANENKSEKLKILQFYYIGIKFGYFEE